MRLPLDKRGKEVKDTEEVVKVAAGDWDSGEKVISAEEDGHKGFQELGFEDTTVCCAVNYGAAKGPREVFVTAGGGGRGERSGLEHLRRTTLTSENLDRLRCQGLQSLGLLRIGAALQTSNKVVRRRRPGRI